MTVLRKWIRVTSAVIQHQISALSYCRQTAAVLMFSKNVPSQQPGSVSGDYAASQVVSSAWNKREHFYSILMKIII